MHVHINFLNVLLTFLMVIVSVGTVNMWTRSHPENRFSRAWQIIL